MTPPIRLLILYLLIFSASLTKMYGQCTPNSIEFVGSEPIYNSACGNNSFQTLRGDSDFPLTGSGQTYCWEVSFAMGDWSSVPTPTTIQLSFTQVRDLIVVPNSNAAGDYRIRRIVTDNSPVCVSESNIVTLYFSQNVASISGGMVLGTSPICLGDSGTLTLQGQTGPVFLWQSKTKTGDGTWTGWTDIADTEFYEYSYSNLTSDTCFRALIDNICEGILGRVDITDKYSKEFCLAVNSVPLVTDHLL